MQDMFHFSCIYKSARKQIVKSALIINLASWMRASKSDLIPLELSLWVKSGLRRTLSAGPLISQLRTSCPSGKSVICPSSPS
jgi:hypothetical protein